MCAIYFCTVVTAYQCRKAATWLICNTQKKTKAIFYRKWWATAQAYVLMDQDSPHGILSCRWIHCTKRLLRLEYEFRCVLFSLTGNTASILLNFYKFGRLLKVSNYDCVISLGGDSISHQAYFLSSHFARRRLSTASSCYRCGSRFAVFYRSAATSRKQRTATSWRSRLNIALSRL